MSDAHELFLDLTLVAQVIRGGGGFEALNEGAELECQQAVFGAMAAEQGQEGFRSDQHGSRLTMDGQDEPSIGILQGVQDLGQITMKLTTPDEAHARLRHL